MLVYRSSKYGNVYQLEIGERIQDHCPAVTERLFCWSYAGKWQYSTELPVWMEGCASPVDVGANRPGYNFPD